LASREESLRKGTGASQIPPTKGRRRAIWYHQRDFWGRSASTWVPKLQGRAEVQATS